MPHASRDAESNEPAILSKRQLFRSRAVEANLSGERLGEPIDIARRANPIALIKGARPAVGQIAKGFIDLALRWRRRSVPFVAQMELTDCGAACVGMVLGYHRITVELARIRELSGTNRDGVPADGLLRAAHALGLRGRGIRTEVGGLRNLPTPAILHWNMTHFVVLESVRRNGTAVIVDPALGRRHVDPRALDISFTGVAIIFEGLERGLLEESAVKSPWRLLSPMARPAGQWALVLGLSVALQAVVLALPFGTRLVIDRVVPNQDYSFLRVLALVGIPLALTMFAVSGIRSMALVMLQARLDFALVGRLTHHLLDLPFGFFQARSMGDLLMRIRSSSVVREILTTSAVGVLLDGTLVIFVFAGIAMVDFHVAILVVCIALMQAAILLSVWHPYRSLASESLEAQARSHGFLMELLAGVETLKMAGATRRAGERWSNLFAREVNVEIRRGTLDAVSNAILSTLQRISPMLVLIYGTFRLLDGSMSLGTLVAIVALSSLFLEPIASLVATALRLSVLVGYLVRMQDVFSTPREQDLGHNRPLPRYSGAVDVVDVHHRYGPDSPAVLENVSLSIKPGQSLGVVGPSGSGKSTLAMIIAGLHVPATGKVLFDGQDLAETTLDSFRSQIGVVSQQSYIFAGTIRENITLGDDAISLQEVMEAAREACIDGEICGMPMGYNTLVSDGGATISGGQRQRIALARALLSQPALLVLDEASSALDAEVEARVMANIRAKATTCVIVAHRLSTIASCDEIVVIEHGRLIESGTHETLLNRAGRYADLVRAQARL